MENKKITHLEICSKGGQACLRKHGKKFYKNLAKLRWANKSK